MFKIFYSHYPDLGVVVLDVNTRPSGLVSLIYDPQFASYHDSSVFALNDLNHLFPMLDKSSVYQP